MADDNSKSLFTELDEKLARRQALNKLQQMKKDHERKEAEKAEKRKINPFL